MSADPAADPALPVTITANPTTHEVTASAVDAGLAQPDPPTNDFLWRIVDYAAREAR